MTITIERDLHLPTKFNVFNTHPITLRYRGYEFRLSLIMDSEDGWRPGGAHEGELYDYEMQLLQNDGSWEPLCKQNYFDDEEEADYMDALLHYVHTGRTANSAEPTESHAELCKHLGVMFDRVIKDNENAPANYRVRPTTA